MIDIYAIATNGYISLEQKAFSVAVDGYYPSDILVVITPQQIERVRQLNNVGSGARVTTQSLNEREDEDLFLLIKIFIELWH